jgi:hypothetical protein
MRIECLTPLHENTLPVVWSADTHHYEKVVAGTLALPDVIIGMDIISLGDFVITNARGKTFFSFVIPTLNNKISFKELVKNE